MLRASADEAASHATRAEEAVQAETALAAQPLKAAEAAHASAQAASVEAAALHVASKTVAPEALRHRPVALGDAALDYQRAVQRASEAAQDAAEAEADAADDAADADAATSAAQASRHAGEEAAIRDELGRRLEMARQGRVPPSRATLGAVMLDLRAHARADAATQAVDGIASEAGHARRIALAAAHADREAEVESEVARARECSDTTQATSSAGAAHARAEVATELEPSELHLHQLECHGAMTRPKHACVLMAGFSHEHQMACVLLLQMADGTNRCMVPGGLLDATDAGGAEGAMRELAEEVFGLRGREARDEAKRLLRVASSVDALHGPFGSTMPHEAYLLKAEPVLGSIDEVVAAFAPNDEACAAVLAPVDRLDGAASEVFDTAGRTVRLRNPLGFRRVKAIQELNLAPRSLPPAHAAHGELTSVDQVRSVLAGTHPPTMLVACEFSGAVRTALEAEGIVALSADVRACSIGGLHYVGDVRDVLPLTQWARVYCFPPCFQQLRADANCLGPKIADCRAFWGCAFVIYCICCPNATSVVVEQSDTIVHDYLDLSAHPDAEVVEFRTSEYGDKKDKFVRLTLRNVGIAERTHPPQRGTREPNEHLKFRNPDERDRARSSWLPFANTCTAVAQADTKRAQAEPMIYSIILAAFALAWYNDGHPVPAGYLASDAQPPSSSARAYQQTRGPGDARRTTTVIPSGATASEEPTPLDDLDEIILTSAHGAAVRSVAVYGEDGNVHNAPTHPPDWPLGTGTSLTTLTMGGRPPSDSGAESMEIEGENELMPTPHHAAEHTVDVRAATEMTAILIFVSVLAQPLVFAHANGFTSAGLILPEPAKRPEAMAAIQGLCTAVTGAAAYLAFMVGEYANGVRVFTAPLDYCPEAACVCRSPRQRRERQRSGAAFIWCTLAALAGAPIGDAAARAILSCEMFVKPVHTLADAPLSSDVPEFKFGVERSRSALARPLLDDERSPPAWRALAQLSLADAALVAGLNAATAAGDQLLDGWAERVGPLAVGDVPPHLLDTLPDFSDPRLDTATLTPQAHPIRTAWLPRPPRQPPAGADAPACPRSAWEMLTDTAQHRLSEWLEAARADLVILRDALARGVDPDKVVRRRPRPIAIGQSEMHPWARGRVWDCTLEAEPCCVVADFHAPILENLAQDELSTRLRHYPDQTLVANLVDGARLDADVELQLVLVPHLLSLAHGYESVAKELRRLEDAGWYRSFPHIPYMPMYFNGNGAVPRKLEDRWRRCVEGGGPRHETCDAAGIKAISINDASHIRFMPQHFVADQRPEFRQWLAARGLPPAVEELPEEGGATRASKWPKERKPRPEWAMRDMAIFGRAAHRTRQAVYTAGDDAKDYYSQMPMAASELSKVGVMFLEEGIAEGEPPRLRFISERVLGFGTHGASNIAQRLSDAIMVMYYEDMDASEEAVGWAESDEERLWLEERLALMRRRGSPCHPIRRFTADPSTALSDIPAPNRVSDIPAGYVCPELRLYSGYMYTDDNELLFVGVARTLRGLRVWKLLVVRINLLMAIEAKRSLGTWCKWLGIVLISGLGLVVVPKAKILRANAAIELTLGGHADFQMYRSLCGLLEHLLAVVLRGRNVMHGLYRPHGPDGASRDGPSAVVVCDDLMHKQLRRWQSLLTHACGVSVKRVLHRSELEALPSVHFDLTSDACYAEVDTAGVGGFMHGLYWYFAVPDADRPLLSIPILEFLGVCFNILTFHAHLCGLGGGAHLLYRTDALTTARTLPEESMRSTLLVEAYQWLVAQEEWCDLAPKMSIQHVFGDCNPMSDCVSRAKWDEFFRRCAHLGVRPFAIEITSKCRALYERVMFVLREQPVAAGPGVIGESSSSPLDQEIIQYASSSDTSAAATLKRLASNPTPLPELGRQPERGPASAQALEEVAPYQSSLDTLRAIASGRAGSQESGGPSRSMQGDPASPPAPGKRRQILGGVSLPPTPEKQARSSSLLEAGRQYARARVLSMTQGGEPGMALRADIAELMNASVAVDELVSYGVNANTWSKDCRAWDMWVVICGGHGCSPHRTAAEARDFPERNAHLLAALMFHAYATCKPQDPRRHFIKPRSALAYPLAIIRIFARWAIPMPSYKMLKAALNGIARMYIAYHGAHSMAPKRSEPMKFTMVRALNAIPDGAQVGNLLWHDAEHDVFMFRRLNRTMIHTAFRLGEIVRHTSGEIMFLTFGSLVWSIGGVLIEAPTLAQLRAMRSGIDGARLAPPRSKPDQWGEIHCPFSVVLTYDADDPINAAAALRDIEERCQTPAAERASTPLFHDARREPYSHHYLHSMLRAAIAHVYGKATASLFSWHSYRSGLATALHAAGVSDAMIQLICRWMCPESLHVYRRMGVAEHERHIKSASLTKVDVIQATNGPAVFADQGYAELVGELAAPRAAAEEKAFEAAVRAALDPFERNPSAPPAPPPQDGASRQPQTGNTRPTATQPQHNPAEAPGAMVEEDLKVGTHVAILRETWPTHACKEMQGLAWHGTVVARAKGRATVRFTQARTRDGRQYENAQVKLNVLRHVAIG